MVAVRRLNPGQLIALAITHVLLCPHVAQSQRPPWLPAHHVRPAVYGRTVDSAQAPVPLVGITLRQQPGSTWSDSSGWYAWTGGASGDWRLVFHCPVTRIHRGRAIAEQVVRVTEATDTAITVTLDLRGCAEPPEEEREVTLRGYYRSGFEVSSFRPCPQTLHFPDHRGTAYEGLIRQNIWVEFTPRTPSPKWPETGREPYPEFYVEWRARLRGPGGYGHMGVAMWQLRVSEITVVRPPGDRDCDTATIPRRR